METKVSSAFQDVLISHNLPTVLIGERINPTGKKKLAAALKAGDIEAVRKEVIAQVDAGADILDVNVVAPGVDEKALLPRVLKAIMETVDVPLSIDINNPKALKGALKIYNGKPIVNSVTGEEKSLNEILPLVKEYGTAVIGLTIDEDGIPKDSDRRLAIAQKIIERAESLAIKPEDVIIDCLALTVGADSKNPGPEDQALVIPRGDLLCWKFIELLKLQISNYKYQTISNDRNSKIQTMSRPGMFWSLNIGICDFRHKTPRQSHLSLTWPKGPGFLCWNKAGIVTIEAIRKVKAGLGVNQTLGASNISFGLPNRPLLNETFLPIAVAAGVTCPTVDVAKVHPAVLAADLILGRDRFAQRYLNDFRKREEHNPN